MTDGNYLRYVVLALQRQGARQLNSMLGKFDLTASQGEVLTVVGTYGPMTIREVGEKLICESGSPSRLVSALVSRGLIVRSVLPHDKRAALLALSPSGRELAAKVNSVETRCEEQLFLGLSPERIRELTQELRGCVRDHNLDAALESRFPRKNPIDS